MPELCAVPCPPWCRRPIGHGLDAVARDAAGVARRIHLGQRSSTGCELEQFETVDADGQVVRGQVSVCGPHGRVPADGLLEVLADAREAVSA